MVKRVQEFILATAGAGVALIVTGLALLASPVITYIMWRNDRKRAAR